ILNRRYPSALLSRFTYRVWSPMDLEKFNAAAAPLIGEHDFRSFCGMLPESGPTVRELKSLRAERHGELVRVEIIADGFLHRMARTLVGTLVECAVGRRDPESIAGLLALRAREATGHTAPAQGLYLAGVRYADGFTSFGEPPVLSAV
ncbi:MAG: tRNA pseudouridine(38-40) synthase TruA, partial [Candidatus Eremiobacteraeota bacterium]|nr:tRNA pseudouridine(38-40) synthase TruA [Candidatus Eremiobacteraeota bacterium]